MTHYRHLLPAVRIISTDRIIVGRRGDQHQLLLPEGTEGGAAVGAVGKVWDRGYWDTLQKRWLDWSEVDGIHPIDESETSRVCREMRDDTSFDWAALQRLRRASP